VPTNSFNKDSPEISACYPQRTFYPVIDSLSIQELPGHYDRRMALGQN